MVKPVTLDKYVARSMKTVQGFMTSLDAQVIQVLLLYQCENNISGNLCEIGVHHGRLFLMLALSRQDGERALAIDLFEDDAKNAKTEHAGRDRALFENARRLGIELSEEEILRASSLDLLPSDILTRTTGLIRFFSVDGGHLYEHVENDLRLAERTLGTDGIIAVDDFFNFGWADVSFATYDFLRRASNIAPFAVTPKKIYLAPVGAAEKYKAQLHRLIDPAHISTVRILGQSVLAVRQGTLRRVYDFLYTALRRYSF